MTHRIPPALSDLFFAHAKDHLEAWMAASADDDPWPGDPDALVEIEKDAHAFLELVEALGADTGGIGTMNLAHDYVDRL